MTRMRISAIWTMAAAVFLSMFIMAVFVPDDASFRNAAVTAIAAVTLFMSIPMVESVVSGGSAEPMRAGLTFGLPLAFFLRQATIVDAEGSTYLSAGAHRIIATAFALSVVLFVLRLIRHRRRVPPHKA